MAAKHTTQSSQTPQTALAERLARHANNVRNPACRDMAEDMRAAARLILAWYAGIAGAIIATEDDATRDFLTDLLEGAEPLDEAAWHALAAWFNPWRPAPVPTDATVEVRVDGSAWRWCLPEV
jgi:hypothetical protein